MFMQRLLCCAVSMQGGHELNNVGSSEEIPAHKYSIYRGTLLGPYTITPSPSSPLSCLRTPAAPSQYPPHHYYHHLAVAAA